MNRADRKDFMKVLLDSTVSEKKKKNAKSQCVCPLKALGKNKVIMTKSLDTDANLCHVENTRITKMA